MRRVPSSVELVYNTWKLIGRYSVHVFQGSHKNLKTEFHDFFSMTDLLFSMTPMVSDMVMIVSHNMHNNHKLESCHSHENKQFHDFLGNFHIPRLFHDSNFFQDFP